MPDTKAPPARSSQRQEPTGERLPTKEEAALTVAETEKVQAETSKLRAETARALSEAENAANMTIVARYARESVERETAATLAGNDYHQVYLFNGVVGEGSVRLAINRLTEWHRLYPGADIEIIFTSGGGDVTNGLALFDFIIDLRTQGHRITTSSLGIAASMAGILLQAGDWRTMGKEAWLMLHEASFHAEGKTFEVEDTVEWIKKVQERILDIFAERSTMTHEEIKEKWSRRNWWIDSAEALRLGFVDALR